MSIISKRNSKRNKLNVRSVNARNARRAIKLIFLCKVILDTQLFTHAWLNSVSSYPMGVASTRRYLLTFLLTTSQGQQLMAVFPKLFCVEYRLW